MNTTGILNGNPRPRRLTGMGSKHFGFSFLLLFISPWCFAPPIISGDRIYQGERTDLASDDRRNHAGHSAAVAGTGVGSHAATGAALMAAGMIPLAVLEFAQSAADSNVQQKNSDQERLLSRKGEEGSQSVSKVNVELPSEIDQYLAEGGIDSRHLVDQLISGKLSPDDALRQMDGMSGKSEKILDSSEVREPADNSHLSYDETQIVLSSADSPPDVQTIPQKTDQMQPTEPLTVDGKPNLASNSPMGSIRSEDSSYSSSITMIGETTKKDGVIPQDGVTPQTDATSQLLEKVLGTNTNVAKSPAVARSVFRQLGVVSVENQNIFRIASRQYRYFGKWRRELPSLAQLNIASFNHQRGY